MPELERVTFEDLPEIGETPLESGDFLTIMRWAVDRGSYIKGLQQQALEAGHALNALWQHEPKTAVGDIDNSALNRFKPTHVYGPAAAFGLRAAQLAAYDELYQRTVADLNHELLDHFQEHDAKMAVMTNVSVPEDDVGVFEHHPGGGRVRGAAGSVVDISVSSATLRLKAANGKEFGAKLLPTDSAIEGTEYLDIALRYPSQKTAAV